MYDMFLDAKKRDLIGYYLLFMYDKNANIKTFYSMIN